MGEFDIKTSMDFIFTTYPTHLGQTERFRRLGVDLAGIVGKDQPWSRSYVSTAYHGSFGEGKKAGEVFVQALDALVTSIMDENVPAILEAARHAEVLTFPDNDISGSFVMGRQKTCASPNCSIRFVPNVPWRMYCPSCRG